MWAPLSVSRWILLVSLALVMILSVSQVDSYDPIVSLSCCLSVNSRRVHRIRDCYEQKPREDCNRHAFLLITQKGTKRCTSPTSRWLRDMIQKGKLNCRPDVSVE